MSLSRRAKRRAEEIASLEDSGSIAPLLRPHTQEVSFTVISDSSSETTTSSLPRPPRPLYLAEATPIPTPPPAPEDIAMPDAPPIKRRVQLQADFEEHFEEILDALLEPEANPKANDLCECGRGLFAVTQCRDCVAYSSSCTLCFVDRHRYSPFHWAEVWDPQRGFFVRHDISKLEVPANSVRAGHGGVVVQLGHNGAACPYPTAERMFTVVDVNGVHSTRLAFCGCIQPTNKPIQLLRSGLFPASVREPLTAFTISLLKQFQLHNFESKKSAYDYMKAIRRLSDNAFTADVANPYAAFLRVIRIYNYLTLRKRAGQAHGIDGVLSHRRAGNLLVWCPACPEPGFNSDPVSSTTPAELRHLNQIQRTLDGNFQTGQFNKNTDPDDVSFCEGDGYMPLDAPYRDYLEMTPLSTEKSTCGYLTVVNKQNKKKFKNMAVTGTLNCQCSHVFVLSSVDMHYGERYVPLSGTQQVNWNAQFRFSNADMALAIELRKWTSGTFNAALRFEIDDIDQVATYDIACEYTKHLRERFEKHFPELVHLVERIRWGVPALHVQGHQDSCIYLFGTAYMDNVAHFHGESAEQYWPECNQLGALVRQMNLGHRHDTLIIHHGDWNWKKTETIVVTLFDDLALAKSNYEKKFLHFVGLTATHQDRVVRWRTLSRTPRLVGKEAVSVYKHGSTKVPSQQAIFQHFIKDDESFARTTVSKGVVANLLDEGLKMQEEQHRLSSLIAQSTDHDLESRKKEIESRLNKLETRLQDWRKLQKTLMPGVADKVAAQALTSPPLQAEKLFLPSDFTSAERTTFGLDDLAAEESRWREGQMFDILRAVQNNVKATNALRRDKIKNDRYQKENMRSSERIRESLRHREVWMTIFASARAAILMLDGETKFPALTEADLYMKPIMDKRRLGDSELSDGALWTALAPQVQEEDEDGMDIDKQTTSTATQILPASGTQMDKRRTGPRAQKQTKIQPPEDLKDKQESREIGWVWQLGKLAKMSDSELDDWASEGDQVQWFRAEADMLRWREQKEQKLAEILRVRRSFLKMHSTWTTLSASAVKPGYAAFARQKAAMYQRMAQDTATRLASAGYSEFLVEGFNLVEWVQQERSTEDAKFERLVYSKSSE
ncbi:CxC2 domain-containing protein [Mycena kentingensis (nom. inval.)]|nr:CxC2 domain-containing protein [Mycena kentingensis (nom. inval.)]